MKKIAVFLGVLFGTTWAMAAGELYLPNLSKNATGKLVGASTRALDINVADGGGMQIEDSAHTSGDDGSLSLAVRNDAGVALADDGDYIALTTDSTGALRVNATEVATAAEGAALPGLRKVVAGSDGSSTLTLKTDNVGELQVDVLSVPATVSTLAEQQTQTTVLNAIGASTLSIDATLVNVDSTLASILNDTSVISGIVGSDSAVPPVGNTGAVVLGFDGTNTQYLRTDNSGELQIDVNDGATLSEQQIQTGHLGQIEIATELLTTALAEHGSNFVGSSSLKIAGTDGSSTLTLKTDNTGALQVGVLSSALPTGAATEATVSALNGKVANDYGASTLAVRTAAQIGNSTGAADFGAGNSTSQTQRVVLATDQGAVSSRTFGKTVVDMDRIDYSGTPVTTAAYTTLEASVAADTHELEIFDSSGETLVVAFGAAASEVDQFFITPGGNERIPVFVPAGTRVSVKAVSANATAGELTVNFYGL